MPAHNFKDLTGETFGKWVVLERSQNDQKQHAMWLCRCECGNTSIVRSADLTHGKSTNCGCVRRDIVGARFRTHGKTRKCRAYGIWKAIKQRCLYKRHVSRKSYSARGITICDEWKDNFEQFLLDMGECPPGMTIERIDNDRGYEPENCRWATMSDQCNNKRSNRTLEHNGVKLSMARWARLFGLNYSLLRSRLNLGWDIGRALNEPVHQPRKLAS